MASFFHSERELVGTGKPVRFGAAPTRAETLPGPATARRVAVAAPAHGLVGAEPRDGRRAPAGSSGGGGVRRPCEPGRNDAARYLTGRPGRGPGPRLLHSSIANTRSVFECSC